MIFLKKHNIYAIFIDNVFTGQVFTEHQIGLLFGNSDLDHYALEGKDYYRVYFEDTDEEKVYTKYYTNNFSSDFILDEAKTKAISPLIVGDVLPDVLEETINIEWNSVRAKRNQLLIESDTESFILLIDVWNTKPEEWRTKWTEYRQKLRDIPQDFENPFEVIWPEKPVF